MSRFQKGVGTASRAANKEKPGCCVLCNPAKRRR